jgi:hypothetical protein
MSERREHEGPEAKLAEGAARAVDTELDEEARAALEEAGAGEEGEGAALEDEGHGVLDEVDVRELLRSALAPPRGAVAPELLRGVQRKLRTRSRGKFYGDGWSTARSPRSTYLVTSALMLFLIAFVYFVLIPWGGDPLP